MKCWQPSFILLCTTCLLRADVVAEAMEKAKAGHPDDAIQMLREDVAKNPGAVRSNMELTKLLSHQHRFDEADLVINAAVKANSGSADLHRVRGDLVFREGQVFEAETEYRAAFKLDGHNARAVYGIARTHQMGALRASAMKLVQAAHTLDPKDEVISEAYERWEAKRPALVAAWQKELDEIDDPNSSHAVALRRSIAIQKELNGRQEWELASAYGSYQAPLVPLANGRRFYGIGLKIVINGVKSEVQVDSGASGLYIGSRLAEKAGVKRLGELKVGGIGNGEAQSGWVGFAERLEVGGVEFRNCIVEVSDKKSTSVDAGGLIGTDVFRRFMTTLNLAAMRLELSPLPGPAWDGVTPVDRYTGPELADFDQFLNIHHYIFVPTKVSEKVGNEQTPGLFLLDSGASGDSISTNLAPDVTNVRNEYRGEIRGLSGRVKMTYRADQVVLQFGRFRRWIPNLMAFDLSHISQGAGVEVAGIMGMPMLNFFRSISLDYRDGRVKFDYKP